LEERLKVKKAELKTAQDNRSKFAPKLRAVRDEIAHLKVCSLLSMSYCTYSQKLAGQLAKAVDEFNDEIKGIQSEPLPVDNSASRRDWEQNIEDVSKDIGMF
jgi:uncharacterized protein HemX